MDQPPTRRESAVNLGFAAVRGDGLPVFSEFRVEIPVELSPGSVSEDMDADVARRQLALGERFSHQALVNVLLDLVETVFVA